MNQPLVSILIPCHNAEKWLGDMFASLFQQSWRNTEIIIVDDGSTDNSRQVIRSLATPAVRLIESTRRGAAAARNRAFEASQGSFIQFLDADDFLASNKIEIQVRQLVEQPPLRVSVSATMHFFDGEDPQYSGQLDDFGPRLGATTEVVDWCLRLYGMGGDAGMVQTGAWLTPREVVERAGPWADDLTLDDDGEFFNRVVLSCSGISVTPQIGVFYRKYRDGTSLSTPKSWQHQRSALTALERKAERTLRRTTNPAAVHAFARHFFERAILAYPDYPDLSQIALEHHKRFGGGCENNFHFGRLQWVRRLLGWRTARRLQALWAKSK